MSRKSQRTAATPPQAQPSRRPKLDDQSARATAKASMRAGFPAARQFVEQLGEPAIAEIEAELATEAVERAQAAAAVEPPAGGEADPHTQTQEA